MRPLLPDLKVLSCPHLHDVWKMSGGSVMACSTSGKPAQIRSGRRGVAVQSSVATGPFGTMQSRNCGASTLYPYVKIRRISRQAPGRTAGVNGHPWPDVTQNVK
ncbi:Hypothetical protein ETA_pET460530 (plasmid) [Erwinia tasmaniensis Et1/99]|uniref:Uncharacterized protein n=1 Tax=Erwinia tasmaniensis (strain DSM 17950 / CFBP 7177 / CIP 109463 / NCPPB 4357 / Et1/99) TaxID=465817 RepID=B2VB55_ERWT9|nr:Hypothetical protein ETA_pET460530 [Erwinia tasmaniensis Et1/99]